jgi:hypothetical protein
VGLARHRQPVTSADQLEKDLSGVHFVLSFRHYQRWQKPVTVREFAHHLRSASSGWLQVKVSPWR